MKKRKNKNVQESRYSGYVALELANVRERVWGGGKTDRVKNNDFENKDVMDLTF